MNRGPIAAALLLAGALTGAVHAGPLCHGDEHFRIGPDETHTGDIYAAGRTVIVDGRQEGDLFGAAQSITIGGVVTGDLIAGCERLRIDGRVEDSVRVFAQTVTLSGTVDGDLLVFTADLDIRPSGRITGDLWLFAGTASIDGTVEGEVRGAGGNLTIGGTLAQGANIEVDTVTLSDGARIGGDFVYASRKELELEGSPVVEGEIVYTEKVEKDEDEEAAVSAFDVFYWFFLMLSAMLVGLVLLALLRRVAPAVLLPIEEETMVGTLIGFGTFLILPAAAVLSMLLVITIPLSLLALVLFVVALYLAKIPVALWTGRRILSVVGMSDPSPYLAFILGIVVLYLLFTLPFFLGRLVWLVTTWLGLGAMILALRNRQQVQQT